MKHNKLIVYGTDQSPDYYCPWHSILLIGNRVIHRYDTVTDSAGLIDLHENMTDICNEIKLNYMISRPQYKLVDAVKAIDPSSVPYHGWYAEAYMKYNVERGASRPFREGFVVATRQVPDTSLIAVSIGIVANISAHLERERLLSEMVRDNQLAGLYDDGPVYDREYVVEQERGKLIEEACRRYRADFDEQSEYVQDKIRGMATDWYKIFKQ